MCEIAEQPQIYRDPPQMLHCDDQVVRLFEATNEALDKAATPPVATLMPLSTPLWTVIKETRPDSMDQASLSLSIAASSVMDASCKSIAYVCGYTVSCTEISNEAKPEGTLQSSATPPVLPTVTCASSATHKKSFVSGL